MTPTELSGALGEMIRVRRIAAGLSQRALGARAGIVGKYVSEIERGTRDLPLSTLQAIVERGLQLHLAISFDAKGRALAGSLPLHVAELAASVAELPGDVRARVVAVVRTIVELAR